MSKDSNKNKSAKVIYDERVFGGSGSGRCLMDASSSSAIMDSETEEEYFKRMHEFNNATRVSVIQQLRFYPFPLVITSQTILLISWHFPS